MRSWCGLRWGLLGGMHGVGEVRAIPGPQRLGTGGTSFCWGWVGGGLSTFTHLWRGNALILHWFCALFAGGMGARLGIARRMQVKGRFLRVLHC